MAEPEPGVWVEVAYAGSERQLLLQVLVPEGTDLRRAVALSGILEHFPELDLPRLTLGVFGKLEKHPEQRRLLGGERIEIYRPLLADPKEARRRRAAR